MMRQADKLQPVRQIEGIGEKGGKRGTRAIIDARTKDRVASGGCPPDRRKGKGGQARLLKATRSFVPSEINRKSTADVRKKGLILGHAL